jgi:heme exporter protein B
LATKILWMIHKDIVSECRARQAWPAMLLLGTVVVLMFAVQMDLPAAERQRVAGGLLWLAIFVASTVSIDRSFGLEQDEACRDGLLLYPLSPAAVFVAKWVVNLSALFCLELVLIPLFVVLADLPLLAHPWALIASVTLSNAGIAAVGTLLSAATSGMTNRGGLIPLLVLPMVFPVMLGAAAATRLMLASDLSVEWWRWIQLLGACAVVFFTAGIVLFEFVVEE